MPKITKVDTKSETKSEKSDKKGELIQLLKAKIPATLEREPSPAYTGNLELLADEILALLK